jgi:hypothetical protein
MSLPGVDEDPVKPPAHIGRLHVSFIPAGYLW